MLGKMRVKIVAFVTLIFCVGMLYMMGAHEHVQSKLYGRPGHPEGGFKGSLDRFHNWPVLDNLLPDDSMRGRYETPEVWRAQNVFDPHHNLKPGARPPRPHQPHPSKYGSPAQYLEQTIVADYPDDRIDDIFLMLKTGGTVMWERLPVHVFTTLTKVKNFAIYSDMAGSIAGYEVIDILKDLPQSVLDNEQLTSYRRMKAVHDGRFNWDAEDINFHQRNDGWANDKLKNIPMIYDAYQKSPNSKWFVFMDDDSYLLWGNLVEYLSKLDHTERIHLGSRVGLGGIQHHGKTLDSFAHGGSGVVISKGAMDVMFGPDAKRPAKELVDHWSEGTLSQCCGDLMISWLLFEEANCTLDDFNPMPPVTRFQGEPTYVLHYGPSTWCEPLMSFHHMRSHEIESVWEYERMSPPGAQLLFYDFYRDFVLPWIDEEMEDWYMRHRSFTIRSTENMPFHDKSGVEIFPNATKEDCRRACDTKDDCYVWSWWLGTCELKEEYLMPGVKANMDYNSYESTFGKAPKVYTGYMIERIRQMRASLPCDPLEYDPKTGTYNDSPDSSEGWALREEAANARIKAWEETNKKVQHGTQNEAPPS